MPDDSPYRNFNFVVEIDGIERTAFNEVILPDASIQVIEYREGSDVLSTTRKLPGLVKYTNLVLRRGLTGDLQLYEWWRNVRDGSFDRRAVRVVLLDTARSPVCEWRLTDAWPTRYAASPLAGDGSEVVLETLELAFERIELEALA